jgi:hypothetical protein
MGIEICLIKNDYIYHQIKLFSCQSAAGLQTERAGLKCFFHPLNIPMNSQISFMGLELFVLVSEREVLFSLSASG